MRPPSAQRLWSAAKILRERGWAQGALVDQGKHCVVGAVLAVTTADELVIGAIPTTDCYQDFAKSEVDFLADMLGLQRELGWSHVTDWNDEPERTAEDVITLLEQAAEKLETEL